jgi:hypothetical protein
MAKKTKQNKTKKTHEKMPPSLAVKEIQIKITLIPPHYY